MNNLIFHLYLLLKFAKMIATLKRGAILSELKWPAPGKLSSPRPSPTSISGLWTLAPSHRQRLPPPPLQN